MDHHDVRLQGGLGRRLERALLALIQYIRFGRLLSQMSDPIMLFEMRGGAGDEGAIGTCELLDVLVLGLDVHAEVPREAGLVMAMGALEVFGVLHFDVAVQDGMGDAGVGAEVAVKGVGKVATLAVEKEVPFFGRGEVALVALDRGQRIGDDRHSVHVATADLLYND